jgi:hypothetical protein
MILEHHKISTYRNHQDWLVEPLRRADWVDVSKGFVTFGLARSLVKEILAAWPNAGFHKRLVMLELDRLLTSVESSANGEAVINRSVSESRFPFDNLRTYL